MLDIQFIRENRELVEKSAKEKQIHVDVGKLLKLDDERRKLISEMEGLQSKRNKQAN